MNVKRHNKRDVKDIREMLYHDLNCSSSTMTARVLSTRTSEEGMNESKLQLDLHVLEGPYKGGSFSIVMTVRQDYPFKAPLLYSPAPLWHPNIDPRTGQIHLPLEWSPVLKLYSVAFAVQLMFLEPSMECVVNAEAGRLHQCNPAEFEQFVQCLLRGGVHGGIPYPDYTAASHSIKCRNVVEDTDGSDMAISSDSGFLGHIHGEEPQHPLEHPNPSRSLDLYPTTDWCNTKNTLLQKRKANFDRGSSSGASDSLSVCDGEGTDESDGAVVVTRYVDELSHLSSVRISDPERNRTATNGSPANWVLGSNSDSTLRYRAGHQCKLLRRAISPIGSAAWTGIQGLSPNNS